MLFAPAARTDDFLVVAWMFLILHMRHFAKGNLSRVKTLNVERSLCPFGGSAHPCILVKEKV
jgi:hypothetical protein